MMTDRWSVTLLVSLLWLAFSLIVSFGNFFAVLTVFSLHGIAAIPGRCVTMKIDPLSWISAIMTGLKRPDEDFSTTGGTLWQGSTAAKEAVSLRDTGQSQRVCFRNLTDETVILCWVDETGGVHHFYALNPWRGRGPGLLRLGGRLPKQISVTDQDHVETTIEGHAFLIAAANNVEAVRTSKSLEGDGVRIIGAYRAEKQPGREDDATEDPDEDTTPIVHLIEVVDSAKVSSSSCSLQSLSELFACCRPKQKMKDDNDENDWEELDNHDHYKLTVRMALLDETPLDTTAKHYENTGMGECRWPVMLEPQWKGDDLELQHVFADDLDHMASCLPEHAVTLLRDSQPTLIWLNRTLKYGPKACPVTARHMCFHPGRDWLLKQGMHPGKSECVELYCSTDYRKTRKMWGIGGLLLHEFSHAYHHKGCAGGYENKEILDCYEAAMKEGLYESVRVHGSQGPTAKAYACTNAMEYFAELSTAFLGGIPSKQKERDNAENGEGDEEFNKWYPFNRKHIREHDPRAYEMLKKMWKVDNKE